ncbi:hypothetical protein ZHAS_00011334 [Anopheles sinensis]|uniref:Uncharacterized protein n=1 Tax=Anopheles sinensis TaxID=74873 RepID=A0A084VZY2_ANOSI|nr:hypothetical protein ZHAS_00011334 [Anopheles sinensis]
MHHHAVHFAELDLGHGLDLACKCLSVTSVKSVPRTETTAVVAGDTEATGWGAMYKQTDPWLAMAAMG